MEQSNPEVQPTEEIQDMPEEPQRIEQPSYAPSTGKLKGWWLKLKKFGSECRRVLKVTQKPNKEEFFTIAKVSALGMAIIGMIGFVLSMIQQLIL